MATQKFQMFLLIMCAISFLGHSGYAQTPEQIEIDPNIQTIRVDTAPQTVFLRSQRKGEGLHFKWDKKGEGELKGDTTSPAIFYVPPTKIEKKLAETIITLTVTDQKGEEKPENVIFTLIDPTSPIKQQDFNLIVETDKDEYKIGDALTITLTADRNCYVWLFHRDIQGNITQLFPKERYDSNLLSSGQTIKIPDPDQNLKIILSEPIGVEMIIAIARIERPEDKGKGYKYAEIATTTMSESIVHYKIIP